MHTALHPAFHTHTHSRLGACPRHPQILENAIKYRWKTLPLAQQNGIKNFIVNLVIQKSSTEEVFRSERVFMTKLNVILVQIVKQEWPVRRPPHRASSPRPRTARAPAQTRRRPCSCQLPVLATRVLADARGRSGACRWRRHVPPGGRACRMQPRVA